MTASSTFSAPSHSYMWWRKLRCAATPLHFGDGSQAA